VQYTEDPASYQGEFFSNGREFKLLGYFLPSERTRDRLLAVVGRHGFPFTAPVFELGHFDPHSMIIVDEEYFAASFAGVFFTDYLRNAESLYLFSFF